jgi:hypothetical protein
MRCRQRSSCLLPTSQIRTSNDPRLYSEILSFRTEQSIETATKPPVPRTSPKLDAFHPCRYPFHLPITTLPTHCVLHTILLLKVSGASLTAHLNYIIATEYH